ncbi:cysteinyl leukotriene receptor 1-like [Gastrophryne carolinensis]
MTGMTFVSCPRHEGRSGGIGAIRTLKHIQVQQRPGTATHRESLQHPSHSDEGLSYKPKHVSAQLPQPAAPTVLTGHKGPLPQSYSTRSPFLAWISASYIAYKMEAQNENNSSLKDDCSPTDDFKFLVQTPVYSIIFLIGLLGNGAAIYVFCKIRKAKGNSTICLLNLAIADLLFIIFLPLKIVYFQMKGKWIFGEFLCRVSTFSFYFCMYSSIFFLVCLSVFRYISVVHKEKLSKKKVIVTCVCIWCFTFASTVPFLLSGTIEINGVTKCFEPSHSIWKKIMYMNYYALIVGFFIPLLVIIVCNWLIIKHIKHMPMEKRTIKKHVTVIVLVLLVCCVCFLPYHVQRTIHLYYLVYHPDMCNLHKLLKNCVVVTLSLAASNACLDPLLYVFIGHGYKSWLLMICGKKTAKNTKHRTSSHFSSDVSQANEEEIQINRQDPRNDKNGDRATEV